MADDARSEANLRHFRARAKQPNVWDRVGHSPVQVFVVYDQGFANQIDDMRFKYIGTSPQYSRYEGMKTKRLNHAAMRSSSA